MLRTILTCGIAVVVFSPALLASADVPRLLEPQNGTEEVAMPVALSWTAIDGADQYQLQVSSSTDFELPYWETTTESTSLTLQDAGCPSTVYWRVRGYVDGAPSEWSQIQWFSRICLGIYYYPTAPGNTQEVQLPVTLQWECDNCYEVNTFNVQIDDDPAFSSPEVDTAGFYEPSLILENLAPNTTYYWRVRAWYCCSSCYYDYWTQTSQFYVRGCCVGMTGNVDGDVQELVDIGDLTAMITYLYVPPNVEPPCLEEGNVDGDPEGLIDVGDLTALISYLYIPPNPEPAACQ
jgi:hypothetical protein